MPRSAERLKARQEILHRANRYRTTLFAGHPYAPVLLSMRHLQRAVCIVRRAGLVRPATLATAGFNPIGGRR
jgi:hypothetical protein